MRNTLHTMKFEVEVRQLFMGGNYSREETINFLIFCMHTYAVFLRTVSAETILFWKFSNSKLNKKAATSIQ